MYSVSCMKGTIQIKFTAGETATINSVVFTLQHYVSNSGYIS